MRYATSTKQIFLITITVIAFMLSACHKNGVPMIPNQNSDKLGIHWLYDYNIRINQALIVYDSTMAKDDSMYAAFPPTNKLYKWQVISNNGCDSISGNYGSVKVFFHCAGTYLVTAKMYDSSTQDLIGNTDTLTIHVSADTLYPTQPIAADDRLNIQTDIEVYPYGNPVDTTPIFGLFAKSTHLYYQNIPNTVFNVINNSSQNNYSYTFTNIRSFTYPFMYGVYLTTPATALFGIRHLTYNVPANLSITWLGKTYTGTVTLLSPTKYTFTWDNSGAVTMK